MQRFIKLTAPFLVGILTGILTPSNAFAGNLSPWVLDTNFPDNFYPTLLEMTRGDVLLLAGGVPDSDAELRSCILYKSTDFGAHWNTVGETPVCFSYLTASSDGMRITAADWGGEIFTSSNGGISWTNQHHPDHWWGFSSSASGEVVVGVTEKLTFWLSRDYGASWNAPFDSAPTTGTFTKSAISANGQKILIGEAGAGYLYLSTDSGATWTTSGAANAWYAVGMSADGSKLFAAASNDAGGVGGVFVTDNDGVTWTQTGPDNTWWQIESTSNGVHLIATPTDKIDHVFVSNDVGQTWQTSPGRYLAGNIALSNNGQYAFALLSTSMDYRFKLYSAEYKCGIGGIDTCAQEVEAKARTAAKVAAEKREAEKQRARSEISSKLKNSEKVTIESLKQAEIPGVTSETLNDFLADIFALPDKDRTNMTRILDIAFKYEVVGKVSSEQIKQIYPGELIRAGLIPEGNKNKSMLTSALKKLPNSKRLTYPEIKEAIEIEMTKIAIRDARLFAALARKSSRP